MPTGKRIAAAASDTHNMGLDVAVPPPPVLGAPLGVTTPGEADPDGDSLGVGEGDAPGHWLGAGEGDAPGHWLGVGEGDAEGSSAAATPLVPPSTTSANDTAANRRSHTPPRR
jgi:hypothetical protein